MGRLPNPYVTMEEGNNGGKGPLPPPPRYNSNYTKNNKMKAGRSRSPCLKCICCCYCILFLHILSLSILAYYFYYSYKPQLPSYNVQNLNVKAFDMQPDFTLKTAFVVTVRAENPNANIGFIYGQDSSVNVVYSDSDLCSGKLPSFHQGHNNVTLMEVDLAGESEFGSGLQEAYNEGRKNGMVPLLVKVKVPVRVVVGEFRMREFLVFVNCSMLVDNLAPNKKINIISSNTTFAIQF